MSRDRFTELRFQWIDAATRDARVLPTGLRIVNLLATTYLNRKAGYAFPAVETIEADLGLKGTSGRVVRKALRNLAELGFLRVEIGRGRPAKNGGSTNRFIPMLPDKCGSSGPLFNPETGSHGPDNEAKSGPHGSEIRTGRSEESGPHGQPNPLTVEPSEEPSEQTLRKPSRQRASERQEIDRLFSEWYSQYPRKKEPEAARKAYEKALKGGASPSDLIAGAMRYAAEQDGQDPQYTKFPATWLNKGCWADEPAEHQSARPNGRGQQMSATAITTGCGRRFGGTST